MIALRFWIVVLAAMAFLGGLAAGRWWTLRDVQAQERGAFEDYALLFEDRFDLSAERARYLRVILESYERELEQAKARRLEEIWPGVEDELAELTRDYASYIRDRVLPPTRRAEFDSAGSIASLPAPPSPSTDPTGSSLTPTAR